ncbi:type II secretion system GspH family protein [Candidatus Parcubacteria bacterium]|nr:type II secretion system GspH family protein [Candidatus Parcubacteria bacterium]
MLFKEKIKTNLSSSIAFKRAIVFSFKGGFTILELLVSMAVMMILFSILFMGRPKQEKILNLRTAAFTLAQDLRSIQEMAMGSGEHICQPQGPTFVYGLRVEKDMPQSSYLIFADCNGNKTKQLADDDINIQQIAFSKDVQICEISSGNQALDLVFAPPDPLVYFQGTPAVGEVFIKLCLKSDPLIFKKVKVNSAGRIEIE